MFKIPRAKSGTTHLVKYRKEQMDMIFFFFPWLCYKSASCKLDTKNSSTATVLFKKWILLIATLGQKTLNWQFNKVIPRFVE